MRYDFLVESYATERIKVLSVWSEFRDEDLRVRPNESDLRGRSVLEQMVHQCVSEDLWFRNMLGIDVSAPPLPQRETRIEFIRRYAEDSGRRLAVLEAADLFQSNMAGADLNGASIRYTVFGAVDLSADEVVVEVAEPN